MKTSIFFLQQAFTWEFSIWTRSGLSTLNKRPLRIVLVRWWKQCQLWPLPIVDAGVNWLKELLALLRDVSSSSMILIKFRISKTSTWLVVQDSRHPVNCFISSQKRIGENYPGRYLQKNPIKAPTTETNWLHSGILIRNLGNRYPGWRIPEESCDQMAYIFLTIT